MGLYKVAEVEEAQKVAEGILEGIGRDTLAEIEATNIMQLVGNGVSMSVSHTMYSRLEVQLMQSLHYRIRMYRFNPIGRVDRMQELPYVENGRLQETIKELFNT